jgi:hypothetical protein
MPFEFRVKISNYNHLQVTEYIRQQKEHTTIGLKEVEQVALEKFRQQWNNNEDEKYLIKERKIKFIKKITDETQT